MGSAASSEGIYTMSVSQIDMKNYSETEVLNTLKSLGNEELVRFLNLYNCHTIRIKRRGLTGNDLLYIEEEDLKKLGLVPKILKAIMGYRDELNRLEQIRLNELKRKQDIEESIRLERIKREHEDMLRKKGMDDMTVETSRGLNPQERERKRYVRLRRNISQRSETTVEIHQMERKLQTMLSYVHKDPNINVYESNIKSLGQSNVEGKQKKSEDTSAEPPEPSSDVAGKEAPDGPVNTKLDDNDSANNDSLANLAALDWCELKRHDFLEALAHSKDTLINEMDEMQLQLSRSKDTIHAIHTRAKLMKYLRSKDNKRKVATEDDDYQHDIDLRIVKKYADYWSESEASFSSSDEEQTNPTTEELESTSEETRWLRKQQERQLCNTVTVHPEISATCPDVETMLLSQGKQMSHPQMGGNTEVNKMSARRASIMALLGAEDKDSTPEDNEVQSQSFVIPRQYLKQL